MKVIVIRGGIAGLAVAIGLRKGGHNVTVLERSPVLQEVLGVLPTVLESAYLPKYAAILRYEHLEKLSEQRLGSLMTDLYGTPYAVIHRYDLHTILYTEATNLGVNVLLSHGITSVDCTLPSATTTDGIVFKGDLIIAADGEKSVCREIVTGEPLPSKDSGDHVYRIVISSASVRSSSDLAHLVDRPSINLLVGPGGHAMTYSLKRDGLLNIVLTMKHEGVEDPPQLPHPVPLDEVKEAFRGWSAVQGLLDPAQGSARWTLLETKMAERWVKGKVALMGDAAHAMLPFLGQGAAMALEDAVVLSTLFKHHPNTTDLDVILQLYLRIRQPRVQSLKAKARRMRDAYAHHDGSQQQLRDQSLAADMERIRSGLIDEASRIDGKLDLENARDSANLLADVGFRERLFGYDGEAEVEKHANMRELGRCMLHVLRPSKLAVHLARWARLFGVHRMCNLKIHSARIHLYF
ncbi:FAD/NAD(P)-binding domain-containing protein [Pleomassaria siparia CBS 279.74]|uniref:FAD/NAD(P)-binding domain-containing protein n=1 Tax=Pleomassaria siparia CBS 279.74 TaxID=1314801 RepID=A0A6G1K0B8_9PLEO|nr:FAD/NAD(P)-binding domain-containing protein [Pleomassaria siparia CBS 279.74]